MRIGDLARQTGVSRRLLRYYEDQGLLRPLRLPNGYREYAETDVSEVRHIRALLEAGLPTSVITRVLHCVHDDGEVVVPSSCPEMMDNLSRERTRINLEISRLAASRQALDSMLAIAREPADGRRSPR
ncbi:MerR family transcriptional regulator [Nonomuraea spiralis]|uniref:MerR family transcriptional regulator n=1 Tax=Nonomuraea spiralis TaxID=46182 RepID=A0ABV5IYD0_9ACTN|nr:MerR family transcriptional regulator [Nonomuraea spiralis]GGT33511.1 MerR family transcriptional regulator [Nonomuraea spiralis]